MDVGEPTQVMTPTLDGPVLAVLVRAGEGLTPGEVHRRCRRGSEPGVRRTLARLVAQGIVLARPAGNAVLYALNREHLAASLVGQLARAPSLAFFRNVMIVERSTPTLAAACPLDSSPVNNFNQISCFCSAVKNVFGRRLVGVGSGMSR